jgi:SprT protein
MTEEKVHALLHQHVPPTATAYCVALWKQYPFQFKVSRSRQSKAGDFFCATPAAIPRITVNHDLNPYLFLLTYIHEVAHLLVFRKYSRRVDPHGKEWKDAFRQLLTPVLTPSVFPEPAYTVLFKHMHNPMASSFADTTLTKAFRTFDKHADKHISVHDLPEGSLFVLRGRYYKKGKLRRTRFLCQELKSKRQYLVPAEALVEQAQLSLGLIS